MAIVHWLPRRYVVRHNESVGCRHVAAQHANRVDGRLVRDVRIRGRQVPIGSLRLVLLALPSTPEKHVGTCVLPRARLVSALVVPAPRGLTL